MIHKEFRCTQWGKQLVIVVAIDRCGGRVATISVTQALKGDGERGDANMVMSVMCKILNEGGMDHLKSERRKILRELARVNLDFLDGIKNYLTNDHFIIKTVSLQLDFDL